MSKFNKILNYFSFEVLKKKIWANFQRIIELINCQKALQNMVLGSGIRIPDLGVKKAPDPGSGSATLVVYRSGSINICSDPDLRIRNSELRITLVIGETNYKRKQPESNPHPALIFLWIFK